MFVSTQKLLSSIMHLFFPLKCLKCKKILKPYSHCHINKAPLIFKANEEMSPGLFKGFFCSECIDKKIEIFKPPFCENCGKKFDSIESEYSTNHLCEECLQLTGKGLKVRAGARYAGIVKESIHLFKYKKKLALADPLEHIVFSGFFKYFKDSEIDLILPVPLHKSKLKQRGFNQAYLVLKNFKKICKKNNIVSDIDIDLYSLKRIRKTEPQVNFTAEERRKNVKNAFKVVHPERIVNKRILLVDDVYTTGATSREASSELLKAGAESVDILVIART